MKLVRDIAPEVPVTEPRHNKLGADNGRCSVGHAFIRYPYRNASFLGFTAMTLAKYAIETKDENKSSGVPISRGLATSRPREVKAI